MKLLVAAFYFGLLTMGAAVVWVAVALAMPEVRAIVEAIR